jgi:hypothetical protein
MTLVIVSIAERLNNDKTEEDNASDNVQGVNERQRERHAVYFGRPIILTEVSCQQIVKSKALQSRKRNRTGHSEQEPTTKEALFLASNHTAGAMQEDARENQQDRANPERVWDPKVLVRVGTLSQD